MQDTYIYIDGIDGTGKTTVIKMLRNAGYINVYDRSILTKMTITPIRQLPTRFPNNNSIIKQIDHIKRSYLPAELVTNRDIMTKLNLDTDDHVKDDHDNAIHIILNASVNTSITRLVQRCAKTGTELDGWESEKSIKYFRSKYLFIAFKYSIPIIDTDNKTQEQVYSDIVNLKGHSSILSSPSFPRYDTIHCEFKFNPDILELEWMHFGRSRIIYADIDYYIVDSGWENDTIANLGNNSEVIFDIEVYQLGILELVSSHTLGLFIDKIKFG
jgi:thymidylate kinase